MHCYVGTILVVEDDTPLRLTIVDHLQYLGFEVIEAADADGAIAILNGATSVSVLFTDIEMPGSMNGLGLAATVRDRWPPTAIIVTSGRSSVAFDKLPVEAEFIAKPYNPDLVASRLVALATRATALCGPSVRTTTTLASNTAP